MKLIWKSTKQILNKSKFVVTIWLNKQHCPNYPHNKCQNNVLCRNYCRKSSRNLKDKSADKRKHRQSQKMNSVVLILSSSSRQQQFSSSVQFNSTSSTLQLHRQNSAVNNIYEIDGEVSGGEYEYCPWTDWPAEPWNRKMSNSKKMVNFEPWSIQLLCSPPKYNQDNISKKDIKLLCPSLAQKQTTGPRMHCCKTPQSLSFILHSCDGRIIRILNFPTGEFTRKAFLCRTNNSF